MGEMKPLALYRRLSPLLRPLAGPYACAMRLRRRGYAEKRRAAYRPACPCVSVGNISWGGTGKTPFVSWLLDWAAGVNARAVVLSRGYGGDPGNKPLLVEPNTDPARSGDEPLLLARAHPEARVVVSPRRALAARMAEARLAPDLFVLDDGMQHLAMARDADIVLLSPHDLADGWNRVIPWGTWREDASALCCASAFAVKADLDRDASTTRLARERLAPFHAPVFFFDYAVKRLAPLFPHPAKEPPPPGTAYALCSGVGAPAHVAATAARFMDRAPETELHFADHHGYTAADARALAGLGLPVLCTVKDAVKLCRFTAQLGDTPVWALETRLRFGGSLFTSLSFNQWWNAWWEAARQARGLCHPGVSAADTGSFHGPKNVSHACR